LSGQLFLRRLVYFRFELEFFHSDNETYFHIFDGNDKKTIIQYNEYFFKLDIMELNGTTVLPAESMKKIKLQRNLGQNIQVAPVNSSCLRSFDMLGAVSEVSEDPLFRKALQLHTTGEDSFQCLDSFFSEHSIP